MKHFNHNSNYKLSHLITLICLIGFVVEIIFLLKHPLGFQQGFFLILFSAATVVLLAMRKVAFMVMYLLSTFTLIAAWRLSALADLTLVTWIFTLAMLLKLVNYILYAYESIQESSTESMPPYLQQSTKFEWQLLFIRLFIGFDLIPHFCEKLFAGPVVRAEDVHAFTQLGVHHPLMMVIIAGCMELGGAFAIACGFLTRFGSICLAIYLMVATYLGHHFSNGFIWASPGGGWEYPVLWTMLILSFSFFGAGDFSLDARLNARYSLPLWLKYLMGGIFSSFRNY